MKFAAIMKSGFTILLIVSLMNAACHMPADKSNDADMFSWSKLPDIPVKKGLSGAFAGLSNDALIIAGGANFTSPPWMGGKKVYQNTIYVLIKDGDRYRWYAAGSLPYKVAYGASVTTEKGVLCLGGTDGERNYDKVLMLCWDSAYKKVEVYDDFPSLPQACSYLSATSTGNCIYVAGGKASVGDKEVELNNFWRLVLKSDREKDQWEKLPSWPGPDRFGAVLAAGGKGSNESLYLFSGKSGETYLKDVYEYNPQKERYGWTRKGDMQRACLLAPSFVYDDSHILIFSGSDGHDIDKLQLLKDKYVFVKGVLSYNTRKDEWVKADTMPIGLVGTTAVYWDNKLIIPGGEIHPGVRTDAVFIAKGNK